jgi:chromosome segregation ATPase
MPTPTQQNTSEIVLLNSKKETALDTLVKYRASMELIGKASTRHEVELANMKALNKELQEKLKSLEVQLNSLTANQAAMAAKVDADKDQIQQLWRWVYWLVTLIVATIVGILVKALWR